MSLLWSVCAPFELWLCVVIVQSWESLAEHNTKAFIIEWTPQESGDSSWTFNRNPFSKNLMQITDKTIRNGPSQYDAVSSLRDIH